MKKFFANVQVALMLLTAVSLFQGCFKDSATRTYTMYVPVYKSVAAVRADIKSNAATPIKNPGKIFLLGNYIFLNEIDKGVHVIDNANPAVPVNKYFIAIPGNLDLAVNGNILYADLYRDMVAIDISDPEAIQIKKITENVFPARTYSNGFIGDTTRVIVDWLTKDTTVSAENNNPWPITIDQMYYSTSPTASANAPTKAMGVSGSMARFTLLNDYLYTVTCNDLNVFNVSQPENPVYTNKVSAGWSIETIYPFKNNLFIGSQAGMFVFSTANPAAPVLQSQFFHITSCDPVIADDNYAYVTLRSGTTCNGTTINELDILNIQDPQSPFQVKSYPLTNPHGLSKSGNTLFVCDGTGGLKVFDASDVVNLSLKQTISGIEAYDIIAQNDNALVVAKDGLYQYSYSNVNNITLRSKLSVNRIK